MRPPWWSMKSPSGDVALGCNLWCRGLVISNDRFLDWGNVISSDKFISRVVATHWPPRKLVTLPCGYPVAVLIMSSGWASLYNLKVSWKADPPYMASAASGTKFYSPFWWWGTNLAKGIGNCPFTLQGPTLYSRLREVFLMLFIRFWDWSMRLMDNSWNHGFYVWTIIGPVSL